MYGISHVFLSLIILGNAQAGLLRYFQQRGYSVTCLAFWCGFTSLTSCRSLRAMIAEFVFFIGIAAVCFSGLLFTLWTLGTSLMPWAFSTISFLRFPHYVSFIAQDEIVERPVHEPWTLKSIAWLMTQIWFGNTYLSFAQASSFHPVFGPILMTGFAALSNTLLLTSE